ncbi:hypothetical protein AAZV13_17G192250 [Glycine max]
MVDSFGQLKMLYCDQVYVSYMELCSLERFYCCFSMHLNNFLINSWRHLLPSITVLLFQWQVVGKLGLLDICVLTSYLLSFYLL